MNPGSSLANLLHRIGPAAEEEELDEYGRPTGRTRPRRVAPPPGANPDPRMELQPSPNERNPDPRMVPPPSSFTRDPDPGMTMPGTLASRPPAMGPVPISPELPRDPGLERDTANYEIAQRSLRKTGLRPLGANTAPEPSAAPSFRLPPPVSEELAGPEAINARIAGMPRRLPKLEPMGRDGALPEGYADTSRPQSITLGAIPQSPGPRQVSPREQAEALYPEKKRGFKGTLKEIGLGALRGALDGRGAIAGAGLGGFGVYSKADRLQKIGEEQARLEEGENFQQKLENDALDRRHKVATIGKLESDLAKVDQPDYDLQLAPSGTHFYDKNTGRIFEARHNGALVDLSKPPTERDPKVLQVTTTNPDGSSSTDSWQWDGGTGKWKPAETTDGTTLTSSKAAPAKPVSQAEITARTREALKVGSEDELVDGDEFLTRKDEIVAHAKTLAGFVTRKPWVDMSEAEQREHIIEAGKALGVPIRVPVRQTRRYKEAETKIRREVEQGGGQAAAIPPDIERQVAQKYPRGSSQYQAAVAEVQRQLREGAGR